MATGKRKAHQKPLTLENLGELAGGQASAIVNAALGQAVRDVEDRGADGKTREVNIKITLKKVGKDGAVGVATVKANTKLPPYETDPTIGELQISERGRAELAFSPDAPDNPDQASLPLDA